jgi:hypothetical protein
MKTPAAIASPAMIGAVSIDPKWTKYSKPETMSQIANNSRPTLLFNFHAIDSLLFDKSLSKGSIPHPPHSANMHVLFFIRLDSARRPIGGGILRPI